MSSAGNPTTRSSTAREDADADPQAQKRNTASGSVVFPPFRLDLTNEQLWHGSQLLPLRPKTFAVLRYLVEQASRLVTREELLHAVWPKTYGSEGRPKECMRELRQVLGDDAKIPRFLETLGRRGYRWIAPLSTSPPVASSQYLVTSRRAAASGPQLATGHWELITHLVGREAELAYLQERLMQALSGERQVVFVTGEPGIGKTTLVEAFVQQVEATGRGWVERGQCVEHYGPGEAYLPVLEALGRSCRRSGGERFLEVLRQYAPTWLVQLPALIPDAEFEVLPRKVQGATQERMLREMAEAVEVLTTERGLVLWLEDLQWSDYSTLDLISYLAQRRERARLLVIGTYRPADVIVSGHPLKAVKQGLHARGQCAELPLRFLTSAAVTQYLTARFPHHQFPTALGQTLHQSTEGNPLFLVNVVDSLAMQGVIGKVAGQWQLHARVEEVANAVPESLRQLIENQLDRLSTEEQRVLEAASVAGAEFSAVAVAAGVEETVEQVEARCEGLVHRGQFLQAQGAATLPDGTETGRYGFLHALYQKVLYDRLPTARRMRLHRQIGARGEVVYSNRVGDIAVELAMHFERGQNYRQAVHYLRQAAQNAMQWSAHREAIAHLTKGLECLQALPATTDRAQQELTLQALLGSALVVTKGYAAPEVVHTYIRARELCQQSRETPQLFPVLAGLWKFHFVRAELQTARELAEQFLSLAQNRPDLDLLLPAHLMQGLVLFELGELPAAHAHLEQSINVHDPQQYRPDRFSAVLYGEDPLVIGLAYMALALWYLGYPAQAQKSIHAALTLARALAYPFSLAFALHFAALVHRFHGEGQAVQERAEAVMALSHEQGFPFWLADGTILRGWALTMQGQGEAGVAQLQQGLAAYRATGAKLAWPYFLALLAETYGQVGQAVEGLSALAEALATGQQTGEWMYEAELYRLKGELLLRSRDQSPESRVTDPQHLAPSPQAEAEAEACFHHAIEIARRQQAKSWELRAAMSLARLWQQQGKKEEARQLLAAIYGWFTEGFDTKDLQEAKALLAELA